MVGVGATVGVGAVLVVTSMVVVAAAAVVTETSFERGLEPAESKAVI